MTWNIVFEETIFSVECAISLLLCIAFLCPFKLNWKLLPAFFPIITVLYLLVQLGSYGNMLTMTLSAVLEISTIFILLWLLTSGDLFRNVIIVWAARNLAVGMTSLITTLLPDWSLLVMDYMNRQLLSIWDSMKLSGLFLLVQILLLPLLRRPVQYLWQLQSPVFRYAIFVLIGMSFVRMGVLSSGVTTVTIVIVWFVTFFFVINLVGILYNRSEEKRLKRERRTLEEIASENYRQYLHTMEVNQELREILKQNVPNAEEKPMDRAVIERIQKAYLEERGLLFLPLSGNLSVDTLMTGYYHSM